MLYATYYMKMKTPPLRVGFDMDGVLLYNPGRIIRPIASSFKRIFQKKKKLHFYYPKTTYEKIFWRFVHKSSIYNAPGINEITELVKKGEIEAYLITARYNFLGKSVDNWVKKNKLEKTFTGVFFNSKDEEPHLFKEQMIKKLKLELYIEDNFDIVNHLKKNTPAEILWIYNILDRKIPFKRKYPDLKSAISSFHHD